MQLRVFYIASLLALSVAARAANKPASPKAPTAAEIKAKQQQEALDRSVDKVALSAQENAIARLQEILKKYRKTPEEAGLLARLGEAWQQDAAIRFRIAHGRANRSNKAVDLTAFNKAMKSSIAYYDNLIKAFPDYPDLHEAWFLRGKAYDEINDKENARRNYLHLVAAFPQSSYLTQAHMRLAEYAIDENHHEVAVHHLEEIEKRPDDPQYPFALFKLGWSHYNLGNLKKALSYLERHVALYNNYIEKGADTSDFAIRESSLMDIAMFYYSGIEKKNPEFSNKNALAYFRRIHDGPALGKMMSRFARLLRAGDLSRELSEWKEIVLSEEMSRPESIEVVMTAFEDKVNKRQYALLNSEAADLVRIYSDKTKLRQEEAFVKARSTLLDTAETLQNLVIKNKKATEIGALTSALAELYLSFTKIVDPADPRVPRAHFNLAEAYFQIGDYPHATEHYRWIVENWKDAKVFDIEPAALRAIAARYEVLRAKGVIPTQLVARSLKGAPKPNVDKGLAEWMQWIDAIEDVKDEKTFLNYAFEANRALYAAGEISAACERLLASSKRRPESQYAIPSASLVLDTAILSEDWPRAYELTRDMGDIKAWRATAFGEKLVKLEADTYYKMAELDFAAKNYDESLSKVRSCAKRYTSSERLADCRLLAAKSLLAMNRSDDAAEYLDKLIAQNPASSAAAAGLVNRARIFEARYQLGAAAQDYRKYLETAEADQSLRERALMLTWFANDRVALAEMLQSKKYCDENSVACDRLAALMWLDDPTRMPGKLEETLTWERATKARSETSALWALAALERNPNLAFRDRMKLLEIVAANWDRVDTIAQLQALPHLPETVRLSLRNGREWIARESTLKPEKSSIKHRLNRIEELEGAATKLMKLSWARVRAEVLNETAEAYTDLAQQLRGIPAPKELPKTELESYAQTLTELAMPFEEKAQEIRLKAFEIAAERKIEKESFDRIAQVYFRDNPSQAKKLKSVEESFANLAALDTSSLKSLDPQGEWGRYKGDPGEYDSERKARYLRWEWRKALDAHALQTAGWYLKEARDSKLIPQSQLDLLRGVQLAASGARAEAWPLAEEARAAVTPVVASQGAR